MLYAFSSSAFVIFAAFVASVLGLSFFLGSKAKSAKGYYAAHGQIGWFTNGIAFAGDYLSAASFLGICGLIAFFGFDGFLYSIGYLAGWIVALFVIAEPIKRLGKFTFADALDAKFNSPGIKITAAISTLIVSVFYLIPQMVGAGALVKPLLGIPEWVGVVLVGVTVTLIVTTAGMVSTTWVQFIKGSLLVAFCTILVGMILYRGLSTTHIEGSAPTGPLTYEQAVGDGTVLPVEGAWKDPLFLRVKKADGSVACYHGEIDTRLSTETTPLSDANRNQLKYTYAQVVTKTASGMLINGKPQTMENNLLPVGSVASINDRQDSTGSLGPISYLSKFSDSKIVTWSKAVIVEADGSKSDAYYQVVKKGSDLLMPGGYFKGLKSEKFSDRLDFVSLMLALFCGTASLPHILIRYYTVKDGAAARKSTVVGIAAIGFFYVITLYLGLGAMTSGALDVTNNNMSAPLLAKSFNNILFAIISAIAFTTVLGTVSGLVMAGAGAVAHDIVETFLKFNHTDHNKVRIGKAAAASLGLGAIVLGILFKEFNVSVLVGWAFNIAASANLPALVLLLFWRRTTAKGIAAGVTTGLASSLGWILLSADTFAKIYNYTPTDAARLSPVPFANPALVTIPLGFLTIILVSLLTKKPAHHRA